MLREGTDYGEREHSLEQKVAQVRAQLERGQARILFDPESNTVTLVLGGRRELGVGLPLAQSSSRYP